MTARPVLDDVTVLERAVPVAGRRVLDVGCGGGALVRRLAAAGADAIGLEVSAEQLRPAVAADRDGAATYVVGRAEALPFADASLDVVLFMKSLHHVPGALMARALAEGRRVLRPDGVLYVAEPLAEGPLFELVRLVDDETEVRRLAQEALAGARAAGLRRAETIEYDACPRFRDGAAWRAHLVAVEPERAGAVAALEDELQAAFDRLAAPDPEGGFRLAAPMRADVLRPMA